MNGVVSCKLIGRFGNQTMGYVFARAHAERVGAEFFCEPWIGQRVFNLTDHDYEPQVVLPRRSERDLKPDETNVEIRCYAQRQEAMIYTLEQARSWLVLRHTIEEVFTDVSAMEAFDADDIVCHVRRGDYAGYKYPLVSEKSYAAFIVDTFPAGRSDDGGLQWDWAMLSEEYPTPRGSLAADLAFLPDFYRMVYAPVLLRANSTFSWVAGLLNTNRVFAPVIDGLEGGKEHDCAFVEGNWPKFTNTDVCSDLHLLGSRDWTPY